MSSSVSSGSRGGRGPAPFSPPHLFLDQTKAHRAEKKIWRPGSPLFQGLDDRPQPPPPPPTPLSQGLDPALSVNQPKKVHVVSVCEVGRQFGTLLRILYQWNLP